MRNYCKDQVNPAISSDQQLICSGGAHNQRAMNQTCRLAWFDLVRYTCQLFVLPPPFSGAGTEAWLVVRCGLVKR